MLPDFLILGAAKSGTTALYEYLMQHPQVFMSTPKEPHYWALGEAPLTFTDPGDGQRIRRRAILDRPSYEALFARATPGQVCGEASVSSLYYERTAARIAAEMPGARLIAMLRQPADRAYSGYHFMAMRGYERLPLADALAAEPQRRADGWHHMWHYRHMGMYADQIARFQAHFPAEQLRVVVYDDFARDPQAVLRDVFEFIGVDPTFQPGRVPRPHPSGAPRRRLTAQLVSRPNVLRSTVRRVIPRSMRSGLRSRLLDASVQRVPIDPAVRNELTAGFADDIGRLQELIGRDLSAWLTPR